MNEFKLIVAGGRDYLDYVQMFEELHKLANNQYSNQAISIVSGMARGADALAVRFAREQQVRLYEFPADWNANGKRAGFMRNEEMAEFADGLVAFWDGQSKGTAHMIQTMKKLNKPVHVIRYEREEDTSSFPNQNF